MLIRADGADFPAETPIVIAEVGNNHGGSLELAQQMTIAVLEAGTPYVKFQTMIPERLVSRDDPTFEELSRETLPFDRFRALKRFCQERGAVLLSTPFDPESADLLQELDVPAFKIASGDLTYLPLLRHVARKNRPIMLSTGASTFEEIDMAVTAIREETEARLILMHCTVAYPCPDDEANLALIPKLAERYECQVGFSDHTLGVEVALGAVALGASVVEKHFTIDRAIPGGDNSMSILPDELTRLVTGVKRVHRAIGSPVRVKTATEREDHDRGRRSVILRRDMRAGATINREDLDAVRPGGGLPPDALEGLVDKKVRVDVRKGEQLRSWMIS